MIQIHLDVMLAKRKMTLSALAKKVGISISNLSILKQGKARAIRLATLEKICEVLDCQPGDILSFQRGNLLDRIPGPFDQNPLSGKKA